MVGAIRKPQITDSRGESLNIGRKRVEERGAMRLGPLFTERVLLSMGPLKGMKGRAKRGDACVVRIYIYICADVSFLLNFSRALHPLNCALVRAFSIVPPHLCKRDTFYIHATTGKYGGDVKKTHIGAFDINTRRLENIHSLIECFIGERRQLDRQRFTFSVFYGYRWLIKENL